MLRCRVDEDASPIVQGRLEYVKDLAEFVPNWFLGGVHDEVSAITLLILVWQMCAMMSVAAIFIMPTWMLMLVDGR